jgi:hypothetical protein
MINKVNLVICCCSNQRTSTGLQQKQNTHGYLKKSWIYCVLAFRPQMTSEIILSSSSIRFGICTITYDNWLDAGFDGSSGFVHILSTLAKLYPQSFFVNVLASLIITHKSTFIPFLTILQFCLDWWTSHI